MAGRWTGHDAYRSHLKISELRQIVFFEMQFPAVFKTDRVDNEVGMDVLCIGVRCNDDFVVLPLLRQLQSNGVCFLWCDVFLRVEGLHEMKIHLPAHLPY